MKKEEIRRGLRSLIRDTTKELEKAEKNKGKKRKPSKKEAELKEKINIPEIKVKDNHIKIESHYYPLLNDFVDKIAPHLTSAEEVIYHRLYRLSFGWGISTCRVSISTLSKASSLNSSTTVRKSLKGLIEKKCIIPIIDDDKNKPYDNQVGTLYRVLLPHEILLKQTHDGILLDDVPKKGISKTVLSKFDPSVFDPLKINMTKSVRSDSEGTENKSADPSKNDVTEIDPLSLKHRNNKPLSGDPSKNDITEINNIKKQCIKNNNKNTLSPSILVKKFYSLLNQDKISKQKRERALYQTNKLIREGFSIKDINFTIDWTTKNKSELHSFGIIAETIGEALAVKEKYLETQREKEKLEKEKQEKQRKQKEEEKLQQKTQQIKNTLSEEELARIHQEAENTIKAQGNDKKFGQDILVRVKENEIIRNLYL